MEPTQPFHVFTFGRIGPPTGTFQNTTIVKPVKAMESGPNAKSGEASDKGLRLNLGKPSGLGSRLGTKSKQPIPLSMRLGQKLELRPVKERLGVPQHQSEQELQQQPQQFGILSICQRLGQKSNESRNLQSCNQDNAGQAQQNANKIVYERGDSLVGPIAPRLNSKNFQGISRPNHRKPNRIIFNEGCVSLSGRNQQNSKQINCNDDVRPVQFHKRFNRVVSNKVDVVAGQRAKKINFETDIRPLEHRSNPIIFEEEAGSVVGPINQELTGFNFAEDSSARFDRQNRIGFPLKNVASSIQSFRSATVTSIKKDLFGTSTLKNRKRVHSPNEQSTEPLPTLREFDVEQMEVRANRFEDVEALRKRSRKFDEVVAPVLLQVKEAKLKNSRFDRFKKFDEVNNNSCSGDENSNDSN